MSGAVIAPIARTEFRFGNRSIDLPVDSQPRVIRIEPSAQIAERVLWREPERPPIGETKATTAGADCKNCNSRRFCMPAGYDAKNTSALKGVFGQSRKVKRGDAIFRAGDPLRNLYVVKAGVSKTVLTNNSGREHVTGFHINGDFIGMDGVGTGRHGMDAIALEDSIVCHLPFNALTALGERDFDFQNHLYKLMSREIVRESALLMLMGRMTAVERLVAFLLNLSRRYAERGYSAHEFNLRMTREEIGSHLGLTLETVSRVFSRLSAEGLIHCAGKQISIADMAGLEQIDGHTIPG